MNVVKQLSNIKVAVFLLKFEASVRRSLLSRYITSYPKTKIAHVGLPEMKQAQTSPPRVLEKCIRALKKTTAVHIPCGRKGVAAIFSYTVYTPHVIT